MLFAERNSARIEVIEATDDSGTVRAMTVYFGLPPYMLRIIADTKRHWKYRRPSYTGAYSSFDEATASRPPKENPWWASYVVTVLGRPPNLLGSRMLLPVVAATLGLETNTLNILDFGGGGGFDFRNLLAVLGKNVAVNYTVVDQPNVCEAARAKWADEPRISFRDELPPFSTFFDLVYSFSALQYMRDPLALVAQLASYAARAVLIAGVPFGEQAFVRKETTRGLDTPSWVVSLSETAKQMEKSGYRLALTLPGEEWWNVDNYSGDQKVGRMSAMLFLRIRNRRDPMELAISDDQQNLSSPTIVDHR
jgi:putative methyltransferase (TIGR04325 family)